MFLISCGGEGYVPMTKAIPPLGVWGTLERVILRRVEHASHFTRLKASR